MSRMSELWSDCKLLFACKHDSNDSSTSQTAILAAMIALKPIFGQCNRSQVAVLPSKQAMKHWRYQWHGVIVIYFETE